jgi:hypothetical protein
LGLLWRWLLLWRLGLRLGLGLGLLLLLLLLLLLALIYTNAKIPRLHKEVPYATGLIHINLHEIACFTSAQLAATSGVLAHKRLLDYQIGFGQDAKRGAKGLLGGCQEV